LGALRDVIYEMHIDTLYYFHHTVYLGPKHFLYANVKCKVNILFRTLIKNYLHSQSLEWEHSEILDNM